MEKSIIQKDIEYFASKYSLIELFHGNWMNYSVLKAGSEPQKKSIEYYIYCYQKACYKKLDARFPNFLFLEECFRKQLKLYRPPSRWCNEDELSEYIDFCLVLRKLLVVIFKKCNFF